VEQVKAKAAAARNGNLKRGQSRQRNVAPSGKTAKVKAEALKVSERTVQTTERVAREAPEQLERIERGETSAGKALAETAATKTSAPIHTEDARCRVTDQVLNEERHLLLDKVGKRWQGQVMEFADNARKMFQAASARERKALSRYLQILIEWSCQPQEGGAPPHHGTT
jgi:hypothetical protein